MESLLLALALSVCADDPKKCNVLTVPQGKVVTVCGLSPDKEEPTIELTASLRGVPHLYVLEDKCESS